MRIIQRDQERNIEIAQRFDRHEFQINNEIREAAEAYFTEI